MPDAITRESGLGLTFSLEMLDPPAAAIPPSNADPVVDIQGSTDEDSTIAPRSIENRLRRAIAAQAAGRSVRVSAPALAAPAVADGDADALEMHEIEGTLRQWLDRNKAMHYLSSPSQLLRGVANLHHRRIPVEFETRLDPSLLEDERVLDTAAVLYHQLTSRVQPDSRDDASPAAAGSEAPSPRQLSEVRQRFIAALREDYTQRRPLAALMSVTGKAGQNTPFFDGFVVRNALHKTFDELALLPGISTDPGFAALPLKTRRQMLEKKFEEMGESTAFAIGTPEHSLATALLRIQSYRGLAAQTRFEDRPSLIRAFREVEAAWEREHFYPVHPRLLVAAHLARSEGAQLMGSADLRLFFENRISDPAAQELEKGNSAPFEAIERYLSRFDVDGKSWKTRDEEEVAQVIVQLIDFLREAADRHGPVAEFARQLRRDGALVQMSPVHTDQASRLDALVRYGNERLLAVFGSPPRFDRREAAAQILRNHGMTNDEIGDMRNYVIAGDNPHVSKEDFGDRVDEFLDRADWTGLVGSTMRIASASRQISPREELQRAEERFNAALTTNAWVVARAKENLWEKDIWASADVLSEEVARVAGGAAAETESHRAWVRGAETWINTVPVAGAVYNIEEGVRHRDAARAAFGLLSLGLDLFDLAGTGAGRAGAGGRAHPVVARMRHAAAHVDRSMIEMTTHPRMMDAAADPVGISLEDGAIPAAHRGLATRVRGGERKVNWRDYDVVHLEHQNRIVPVKNEDGVYFEVDWQTGRPLRASSSFELDADSGLLRPRHEEVGGAGEGQATGSDDQLDGRYTVDAVRDIMKPAQSAELRNFDQIFDDYFQCQLASDNSATLVPKPFFASLYERSATFRRLVNRFDDINGRALNATRGAPEKWEIRVGNVSPLGSPTSPYTDFSYRRIYMPANEELNAMRYMSADGFASMSGEQVYVQEMIRALTQARDPEYLLGLVQRGPAVYLGDKVLSEAGYDFAEQVMYRRENPSPATPPEQTVEHHRGVATRAAHAENRDLDEWLDASQASVTDDTVVGGLPLQSRVTVRQVQALAREAAPVEPEARLSMERFHSKFTRNFGFFADRGTAAEIAASDAKTLMAFYGRLYAKSGTFRRLFDRMPTIEADPEANVWRFMLDKPAPDAALLQGASAQAAPRGPKEIYLHEPELQYLSANGLRDVEYERKLTYDAVRAMGGGKMLMPGKPYTNRGAAVYLTDRILKEAGFNFPRQIAAAVIASGDQVGAERLIANQTLAQRSAIVENRYLNAP